MVLACPVLFAESAGCLQHLEILLGAPDQEVVTATLVTLVALVRKTHIASIRYPGSHEQNARLLALAQGWGGKEQVRHGEVYTASEVCYSTCSVTTAAGSCINSCVVTGTGNGGVCTQ